MLYFFSSTNDPSQTKSNDNMDVATAKKQRTTVARKVTRKMNELNNAITNDAHVSEIQEKIATLKFCMDELGVAHDDYMDRVDDTNNESLETEDAWYNTYDVRTNKAVKTARDYIGRIESAIAEEKKSKQVKLQKLQIPKFESDPKDYYKWKADERYTQEFSDEIKYD